MSIIACSGFEEEPGANFTPPTLGAFMENQKAESRRLREARAGAIVSREGRQFHERQARKHGINTNRGIAHFRASKMYAREGNRLQEMFENGGEIGELPPKAIMKANKAAMLFHKKQAEKAGLDSDVGHAHVAAMEHHADIMKKARQQHEAQFGYGGKKSPVPVPKKSEQPSEDIKQNKPAVKLNPQDANKPPRKLQQTAGAHAGKIRMSKRESGRGPDYGLDNTFPSKTSKQVKDELIFRGHKHKMFDPRKGRDRGKESGVHVSPKDQDPTPKEGYEDSRYAGIKKREAKSKRRQRESNRDEDAPVMLDIRDFYKQPDAKEGWKNSNIYSPVRLRETQQASGVVIKEF